MKRTPNKGTSPVKSESKSPNKSTPPMSLSALSSDVLYTIFDKLTQQDKAAVKQTSKEMNSVVHNPKPTTFELHERTFDAAGFEVPRNRLLFYFNFTPDQKSILFSTQNSFDHYLNLLDIRTNTIQKSVFTEEIIRVSDNAKYVVAPSYPLNSPLKLSILDPQTGELQREVSFPNEYLDDLEDFISYDTIVSNDGKVAVMFFMVSKCYIYNSHTNKWLLLRETANEKVDYDTLLPSFTPDGMFFIATATLEESIHTARNNGHLYIQIWNANTGAKYATIPLNEYSYSMLWTDEVDSLATSNEIIFLHGGLWDIKSGKLIAHLHNPRVSIFHQVKFSPDGSKLFVRVEVINKSFLSGSFSSVVWDVKTKKIVFSMPQNTSSFRLSADGKYFALMTLDTYKRKNISVYKTHNKKGHPDIVKEIGISPKADGSYYIVSEKYLITLERLKSDNKYHIKTWQLSPSRAKVQPMPSTTPSSQLLSSPSKASTQTSSTSARSTKSVGGKKTTKK